MLGVAIGISLVKVLDLGAGGVGSTTYLGGVHNKAIIVSVSDERSSEHGVDSSEPPVLPSLVEEYIPAKLRHKYEAQNLQFNVTRSMFRQSRPIIGNVRRLHGYLRKLQSQQCTNVLILGGSVSAGHHVRGKFSYPILLAEWLNERYPCTLHNGTRGAHQYHKTHGTNSQQHLTSWSMVDSIERFDLVILEFNINDALVAGEYNVIISIEFFICIQLILALICIQISHMH